MGHTTNSSIEVKADTGVVLLKNALLHKYHEITFEINLTIVDLWKTLCFCKSQNDSMDINKLSHVDIQFLFLCIIK